MSAPLTTLPGTVVRVTGERGYFRWLRVTHASSGEISVWLMSCKSGQYKFVRPERVRRVRYVPAWTRIGPLEAVA